MTNKNHYNFKIGKKHYFSKHLLNRIIKMTYRFPAFIYVFIKMHVFSYKVINILWKMQKTKKLLFIVRVNEKHFE